MSIQTLFLHCATESIQQIILFLSSTNTWWLWFKTLSFSSFVNSANNNYMLAQQNLHFQTIGVTEW